MSGFKTAFAAARKAGKKEFSYNGKRYNTELKETAKPKARNSSSSTKPKARPSSSAPKSRWAKAVEQGREDRSARTAARAANRIAKDAMRVLKDTKPKTSVSKTSHRRGRNSRK